MVSNDTTGDGAGTAQTVDQRRTEPASGGLEPPPRQIGRYRVLETLGSGGMGTVFCAYDPKLDRKVALKLLHARHDEGPRSTRARSRLQREARAIAQVKHPHVIHVYDVGVVEHRGHEQVFVAMELVEGQSLRTWLERLHEREAWHKGQATDEIVRVMVQAGRGLAAAHRAGLVHRDFKPDNALLGDDGLVRVVDFGLARRADVDAHSSEGLPDGPLDQSSSGSLDERITMTGAAMGTPAYMAREQFLGEAVDGRTDQFAFCLTLFEALYGVRAFPQKGRARAMAVIQGQRLPFPDRPPVPAHVRVVLDRGLRRDPDDRYPSMDALLQALLDDPRQRRRERLRWGVGGTVVLGAAAVIIATRPEPAVPEDVCGHGRARVDAVWNAERDEAIDRALRVESLPYAARVAGSTREALAAYAEGWARAHRDACEATHVRHEQTGALLDVRMACLDRRLAALEASVELLASAEPEQVEHARAVAEGLPALADCADRVALEAASPPLPDDADRDAVADVHAQLERAAALQRIERFEEALTVVEQLAPQVDAIDHPPLLAQYQLERGTALVHASRFEPGAEALRQALMRAQALSMDAQVRDAASQLSVVVGTHLAQPEQALPWAWLAEATDERIGPTPASQAELLAARAWVLAAWGMDPDAALVVERAYEAALQAHEPDDFEMISVHSHLGSVYAQLGKFEQAQPHFERTVELAELHLGTDHPSLLGVYRNLGNLLSAQRKLPEAERYLQRAAKLVERIPGVGAEDRALIASSLGNQALARGDFEQCRAHQRQALELREQIYGAEHPMVARTINNLAGCETELGHIDEAVALYRRSVTLRERAMGSDHASLLLPLTNLGILLVKQGRPDEAVGNFERAHALLLEHGDTPRREAEHYFWFGRALVESGRDRARGMELVHEAAARFEAQGDETQQGEVQRWISAQGS